MTELCKAKYMVRAGKAHMATPIGLFETLEAARERLAKLKDGDIVSTSGILVEVKE